MAIGTPGAHSVFAFSPQDSVGQSAEQVSFAVWGETPCSAKLTPSLR